MNYIKTFESYLGGGRSPIYHFTNRIKAIITSDILKTSYPSADKFGNINEKIKSISLTRFPNLASINVDARIELDTNKLTKNGYKPYPIDEIGTIASKQKISKPHFKKFLAYTRRAVHNNINSMEDSYTSTSQGDFEYEYEERIDKDIINLGKYITYIDISDDKFSDIQEELSEYIKKYPHIVVRKMKFKSQKVGNTVKKVPTLGGDILLNINIINKKEKELVI